VQHTACHKTVRTSLASQQAPTAGVSLTTWRMSLAPLHLLLTTLALGPKVVRRGCSGAMLIHHVVSDTLAGGACGDDSDIQAVMWHAGFAQGSCGSTAPGASHCDGAWTIEGAGLKRRVVFKRRQRPVERVVPNFQAQLAV
jgi:hypothetical protein